MKIDFYGVRGSIPAPGSNTVKYGGNTSCVHVQLNKGKNIILDAGTGIRSLGQKLVNTDEPIFLLVSHSHWDHMQGYPFFLPIYQKEREIYVCPSEQTIHDQLCSLLDQMDGAHFPVEAKELPSRTECVVENVETELRRHGINITRKPLNHPGSGSAYKITEDGLSCAYVTDNELDPPDKIHTTYDEWVAFCADSDILIHDAQYTEADMPHKHGWGHSLISQVRQLALDAKIKTLILFHHDPDRTDAQLTGIQQATESFFKSKKADIKVHCAWEGLSLQV